MGFFSQYHETKLCYTVTAVYFRVKTQPSEFLTESNSYDFGLFLLPSVHRVKFQSLK